jgi:hypothetical protein
MITLIAITCILVILYVIFRAVGGMERSLARRSTAKSAAKSAAKKEEITVVQQRDITSGAILARRKVTPELLDLIAERSTENLKPLDVIVWLREGKRVYTQNSTSFAIIERRGSDATLPDNLAAVGICVAIPLRGAGP